MNKVIFFFKRFRKRVLIVAGLTVLLIIAIASGLFYPRVNFKSTITDSNFVIYNQHFKLEFKTPFSKNLKPGTYFIKPTNTDKYTDLPHKINIKNAENIDLEFEYSTNYYKNNFKSDLEAIKNILVSKYKSILEKNLYTITDGKFFKNGTYYATSIGYIFNDAGIKTFSSNVYHVIFQKTKDEWKQVTHPELIISSLEYSNIPLEIIQEVNLWDE